MPFGLAGFALGGLSAGALGALAATGGVALAALYLLRRRRARVVVPFVSLWVGTARDARSDRWAERLRRLGSLALQLAILGAILLGAADPSASADAQAGRTVVLLIDRSASMQARDEPGSRLARARALAHELVNDLGAGDRAAVIAFSAGAQAIAAVQSDHARLAAAIDAVVASDEPGDPAVALAFAVSLLRGRPHPTLIVISDGAGFGNGGDGGDGDRGAAALAGIDVRFAGVGRRRDNVAIVAFSARRRPADPSSVELALAVQSFRARASDVAVSVTAGPAHIPIARRTLHLAPGARAALTVDDVPMPDARLEAAIAIENAGGGGDDLPLDDRAFAVVPELAPLRVLVVGERDLYLEGALLGLGGAVDVRRLAPEAATRAPPAYDTYDAVVFDGSAPAPPPSAGRFIYIDPHGVGSPWPERGAAVDPVVTDARRDHPLLRHVGLADLNIASARRLALGAGDVAVVSALRTPLVVASVAPGLRRVALAFDLRRSDLPLRAAFPLLIANALAFVAARPEAAALSRPTGQTVRLDLPAAPASEGAVGAGLVARVVGPAGGVTRAAVAGTVTLALDRAGFTEVRDARDRVVARVAANLASPAESDLAPERAPRIGGRVRPAPEPRRARPPAVGPAIVFVLAALALIAAEWIAFHRRVTV